jgi:hypothetical protein
MIDLLLLVFRGVFRLLVLLVEMVLEGWFSPSYIYGASRRRSAPVRPQQFDKLLARIDPCNIGHGEEQEQAYVAMAACALKAAQDRHCASTAACAAAFLEAANAQGSCTPSPLRLRIAARALRVALRRTSPR